MITRPFTRFRGWRTMRLFVGLLLTVAIAAAAWKYRRRSTASVTSLAQGQVKNEPRRRLDSGGFNAATTFLKTWGRNATLADISSAWDRVGKGAGPSTREESDVHCKINGVQNGPENSEKHSLGVAKRSLRVSILL